MTAPPRSPDRAPEGPVPPPVDPRLRARRIDVARRAGRRRLVRLLVAVVVTAVVAAGWGLTRSPLLDVDRIEVRGAHRSGPEAVRAAAGVATGTPLLDVDPGAVRAGVGSLPWVEHVSVTRDWPGTLRVAVRERRPVARLGAGDGAVVVDRDGRVLAPAAALAPDEVVPLVVGVEVAGAPGEPAATDARGRVRPGLARALEVAERLPAALGSPVDAVIVDDGAVDLELGVGRARLGARGDVDDQLVALATVLARVDLRCVAVIDVRVPSAPSVTRDGALTGDPACG